MSRHARHGIVTIYTATPGKSREIYHAIIAFLSTIATKRLLNLEERRQHIIVHTLRKYGTIRWMSPPDINDQMTMPPA